jgi:hypothetical protein
MDEPLGSTIGSSKLKAQGSRQKSNPPITRIISLGYLLFRRWRGFLEAQSSRLKAQSRKDSRLVG